MKKILINVLIFILIVSFSSIFIGCTTSVSAESTTTSVSAESTKTNLPEKAAAGATNKWDITYICHAPNIDFFQPTKEGAQDFIKIWGEDRVNFNWTGPQKYSVESHVDIVQQAIPKSDAIVLTAPDPVAFNKVIADAKNAGLPVVVFNADAPTSERDAFVGQDRVFAGMQMGEAAVEYANKYLPDRGKGEIKYFITAAYGGHSAIEEIINGYKLVLNKDPRFVNVVDNYLIITNDPVQAYSTVENQMLATPGVDFILGSCSLTYVAGQYVRKNGLQDKVHVFGVTVDSTALDLLKDGSMKELSDQNPYMQGYVTMSLLYAYLENNRPIKGMNCNTGASIVTKENMSTWENFLKK